MAPGEELLAGLLSSSDGGCAKPAGSGIVGRPAPGSGSVAECWGTLLPECPELRCVRGVDVPVLAANRALGLEERSHKMTPSVWYL